MQLYAHDENGRPVAASKASKKQNYFCLECDTLVRLRHGSERQAHFFHLQPNRNCRQSNKTLTHLQVQQYLLKKLPIGECSLEHRFPEIQRIADAVWIPKKIVFEVQYSPISADEIRNRNRDYASVGYQVVWILHEQRFNRRKASPAEIVLQGLPMYYTNMDQNGEGVIYDQFCHFGRSSKRKITAPMPIEIETVLNMIPMEQASKKISLRIAAWPYCFKNDLIDFCNRNPSYAIHLASIEAEKKSEKKTSERIKEIFTKTLIHPYLSLFRMMLEKACR